MSTAYHLRPVSDFPRSPSTTASTVSPSDHSPHHKASPPHLRQGRRPLTPSSLRGNDSHQLSLAACSIHSIDVDLSQAPDMVHRNPKFPAPPTGHDLMAMFPAAPPDNVQMRPGPTSGFFQRQERAFFAQAGKEIVRVRVDVDVAHGSEDPMKARLASSTRPWTSGSGSLVAHSPAQNLLGPYPSTSTRPRLNNNPPPFPPGSHSPASVPPNLQPPSHHPTNPSIRTPPQEVMTVGIPIQKPEFPPDDPLADESWRRPMPYAERRRAGKHTKRVLRT